MDIEALRSIEEKIQLAEKLWNDIEKECAAHFHLLSSNYYRKDWKHMIKM